MKARKTIEVERIKQMVNYYLKNSPTDEALQREGECQLLEAILAETGNIRGFRYLETDEVSGSGTRREYL